MSSRPGGARAVLMNRADAGYRGGSAGASAVLGGGGLGAGRVPTGAGAPGPTASPARRKMVKKVSILSKLTPDRKKSDVGPLF